MNRVNTYRSIVLHLILSVLLACSSAARTWTSSDGTRTFTADFISSKHGKVTVRKAGRIRTFSLSILSEADKKWILQNNVRFRTIGYLPNYRVNDQVLAQLNHYTDIVYFGAEINADGSIQLTQADQINLKKISGMIIWEVGQDTADESSLSAFLKKEVLK